MFVDLVQTLLGTAPVGYEVIEYVIAASIAALVVRGVIGLFSIWQMTKF